jgi:hypothetical protein
MLGQTTTADEVTKKRVSFSNLPLPLNGAFKKGTISKTLRKEKIEVLRKCFYR